MRVIVIVGLVIALGLGVAGWVFSQEIRTGVLELQEFEFPGNVEVKDVSANEITLVNVNVGETELDRPEIAGVVWDGGYGQVTEFHGRHAGNVVRTFRILEGEPPEVGVRVSIDEYAYRGDPGSLGLAFDEVMIEGPIGDLPTWVVPGGDDWVVLVHGRQDRGRSEMLRLIPFLHEEGFTVVVPTLRGDEGAPAVAGRRTTYGATEWEDLHAIMGWAELQAPGDVSVIGYSMGAAVTVSWMMNNPVAADEVRAVILDSPALDIGRTVELHATDRVLPVPMLEWHVPVIVPKVALFIAELRFDFDFGQVRYADRADDLPDVPILILHGTEDVTIPVETSRTFADAVPRARLVELFGAHTRMWNVDRALYEREVLGFLARYEG